jgi:hypothetical protein
MEIAMINWPEMLRNAEDWAKGFWAGTGTVSLIGIAGVAVVPLVHAI